MAGFELEFRMGRRAQLLELRQTLTEGGRLEGLPTRQGNKKRLDWLVQEASGENSWLPVALIPPVETPIPYEAEYPFGDPARLPAVTCVARLVSKPTPRGTPHVDESLLAVVWLQESFAMPIDPTVVDYIASLDWDALAKDYEI